MALTKVTKTGITDNAIDGDKIEDGTVVAADIAPGTISNDKIAAGTIANDKLANSSVTINNSAVSLGGSIELATGTDWQAVTVADGSTTLNAEAGKGYFLDTNAGVIEVFLPSSPARGDKVILADYSGTFATNQIIINTGGELLDSTAGNDFKVTTNNAIVELVYVDSAKGWLVKLNQAAGTTPDSALTGGNVYDTSFSGISATGGTITVVGGYKIHTFTGDGCFVVSSLGSAGPCAQISKVSYMVVAGGGGNYGSSGIGSGGGGAGGYREGKVSCDPYTASPLDAGDGLTVTTTTYPITVGAGACGTNNGSPSIFSTITSAGGGYGRTRVHPGGPGGAGIPGGSGGGGGDFGPNPGGSGNTPPTSPPQGNPGFAGSGGEAAGGGGGAGGGGPTGTASANPGPGVSTGISGSSVTHAAGGDGEDGNNANGPIKNAGGAGMGSGPGFPGTPNPTAQAKTGMVIIRYKVG